MKLATNAVRHLLDADVESVHGVVVELAAVGDLVFQIRDSSLQTHEIVVGLQLRIILGDGFSLDRSLDRVVRRTSLSGQSWHDAS